jgi:hypothetical protein
MKIIEVVLQFQKNVKTSGMNFCGLGVCFKVIVKTGGAEGKVLHVAIWEQGSPFQDMWA